MSRIDQLYRRLLLTKFFTKGWGKPDNLKRLFEFRKILSDREKCQHLVASDYPIFIDKEYKDGDCRILEGHFMSPFIYHLPGIMPKEVENASFQMILPLQWKHTSLKPVCIHLAGTGDHFFWRRRLLTARPLLKESGIASILLENPYYGSRKPKSQLRSSLHNVSDLFVMGGALVLESLALLHWCEREGWGPLGISGISMGGHMASLAATNWPKPLSLIPCLSWSTASQVFTQGVMSGAIPWETLQEQFFENSIYQEEISKLIRSPERNNGTAYNMGQQFARNYALDVPHMVKHHHNILQSKAEHATDIPQSMNNVTFDTNGSNNKITSTETSTPTPTDGFSILLNENTGKQNLSSNDVKNQNSETCTSLSFNNSLNQTSTAQQPKIELNHDSNSSSEPALQTAATKSGEEVLQMGPVRKARQALTLNYAQTKQSQQFKTSGNTSEKKALTLSHAQAKSKLMVTRKSKKNVTDSAQLKSLQKESYDFMIGVMDECTHLGNFSVPVDPELIIIISAKQDAYVPKEGVLGLDQLWPGCEVRYIDQGHVGAVVFHQAAFRKAVKDCFDKQIRKYYPEHIRKSRSQLHFPQSRKMP